MAQLNWTVQMTSWRTEDPSLTGRKTEKLQVQSVGEADCEYKAIYPRKKFSMNLTTLTSKFSAIN